MATAAKIISDWTTDEGERHVLYTSTKSLIIRWLNEAQLRFADRSEVLQGVWDASLIDGSDSLPDDFLREKRDGVLLDSKYLSKGDYTALSGAGLTSTSHYAIWDGSLHVFSSASGEATIPYIRKPSVIKDASIGTASLEIPSEYQHSLITFLDAMFLRRKEDLMGYRTLLKAFDQDCTDAGIDFQSRRGEILVTKGGLL